MYNFWDAISFIFLQYETWVKYLKIIDICIQNKYFKFKYIQLVVWKFDFSMTEVYEYFAVYILNNLRSFLTKENLNESKIKETYIDMPN